VRLRALLVDDEPLARLRLRDLIAELDWLECAGEAADAREARRAIDALDPDLVFLDVEMPGALGTELAARLGPRPAVVFTTAYDRYAVTAFELHALDYLLKPFGRARFRLAAERARAALGADASRTRTTRGGRSGAADAPLERLFVRDRGRITVVPAAAVERIEAQDDYAALHADGRSYLVHLSLQELERRLDPRRFVRVHRRHIVNLEFVRGLVRGPGRRLSLELASGARLGASRRRAGRLRGLAG